MPEKSEGAQTRMIDVGAKADTRREAIAEGSIAMLPATLKAIAEGSVPKGNVLETARVAAVMAAKRTPELIPLCHPLPISFAGCEFETDEASSTIVVRTTVRCTGKTGVEMEALTAATAALLTIYDMTKGIDGALEIRRVRLVRKTGGKSGDFEREGK